LTAWFNNGHTDASGKSEGSYTSASNTLLYSIYSWPNVILAFIGGFLIDKVTGVRKGSLIFCGLVALGQLVFSFGCQYKIYWLAVLGRFVFGLGGENLTVAQNTFTVRWFDGKRLALAFGLVVAFSRIGTSVNFVVSPQLANMSAGVPWTVWFGMGMCCISFSMCCMASYFDMWGEKQVESQRQIYMTTLSAEEAAYVLKLDSIAEPVAEANDGSLGAFVKFWVSELKMLTRIPVTAWLLFLICAVFYVAILNFYQVASDMMQNTGRKISSDTAGLIMAIPNFVAIVGSPLGGFTVDKMGRALIFIATACLMLIGAHVFFLALGSGWIDFTPVPVMVWLGCTYSLGASCIWPILSFIVPKEALGSAYGMMTSMQNLFLAIAALVIGKLQDWAKHRQSDDPSNTLQYTLPIWIFIGCASTAFLLTLLLIVLDRARGGKLNASAEERHARLAAEAAAEEENNQAMFGRGSEQAEKADSINQTF
jgi:MFS family permease